MRYRILLLWFSLWKIGLLLLLDLAKFLRQLRKKPKRKHFWNIFRKWGNYLWIITCLILNNCYNIYNSEWILQSEYCLVSHAQAWWLTSMKEDVRFLTGSTWLQRPWFCFGWQGYLPYSDKGDIEVFAGPEHSSVVKCSSLKDSLIQKHPRNKTRLKNWFRSSYLNILNLFLCDFILGVWLFHKKNLSWLIKIIRSLFPFHSSLIYFVQRQFLPFSVKSFKLAICW